MDVVSESDRQLNQRMDAVGARSAYSNPNEGALRMHGLTAKREPQPSSSPIASRFEAEPRISQEAGTYQRADRWRYPRLFCVPGER
jgi:hypothetical protein